MTGHMGSSLAQICTRVKHLGYAASKCRLYREEFEFLSDPFPHEGGIAVHVKTKKDSSVRILQLPLTLLQAERKHRAARPA